MFGDLNYGGYVLTNKYKKAISKIISKKLDVDIDIKTTQFNIIITNVPIPEKLSNLFDVINTTTKVFKDMQSLRVTFDRAVFFYDAYPDQPTSVKAVTLYNDSSDYLNRPGKVNLFFRRPK